MGHICGLCWNPGSMKRPPPQPSPSTRPCWCPQGDDGSLSVATDEASVEDAMKTDPDAAVSPTEEVARQSGVPVRYLAKGLHAVESVLRRWEQHCNIIVCK